MSVREKQSLQYATKETAEKVAKFYVDKVVSKDHKVTIKENIWDEGPFRVVDRRTNEVVGQWEIHITTPEGKKARANAGLDANQLCRSNPYFAALMFAQALETETR